MFKVGEVVKLKAVQGASQRTKNRIREHGPLFRVCDARNSVLCMGHRPALRLQAQTRRSSDGKGGRDSRRDAVARRGGLDPLQCGRAPHAGRGETMAVDSNV